MASLLKLMKLLLALLPLVAGCKRNVESTSAPNEAGPGSLSPDRVAELATQGDVMKSGGQVSADELRRRGVITMDQLGTGDRSIMLDGVPSATPGMKAPPPDRLDKGLSVQDQGEVGACTAFAMIAAMNVKLNQGRAADGIVELSEAHLWALKGRKTDWDTGVITPAASRFIAPRSEWPWSRVDENRDLNAIVGLARLTGVGKVDVSTVSGMVAQIRAGNPVGIAVKTTRSWFGNTTGVIRNDGLVEQENKHVVHAFTIVGVTTGSNLQDIGGGYFVFKNSWGTGWGDQGYGYLPFNYCADGKCVSAYAITAVETRSGNGGNAQTQPSVSQTGPGNGGQQTTPCTGADGSRVRFGIGSVDANMRWQEEDGTMKTGGSRVTCVVAGSPAANVWATDKPELKGQMEVGDLILKVRQGGGIVDVVADQAQGLTADQVLAREIAKSGEDKDLLVWGKGSSEATWISIRLNRPVN